MEPGFLQNILWIVITIIFILATYSGIKTYYFLKKYIDVMLLLRAVDSDSKIEEYSIRISELQGQLLPWGLSYILNIVLFTILLYVLFS